MNYELGSGEWGSGEVGKWGSGVTTSCALRGEVGKWGSGEVEHLAEISLNP